MDTKIECTVCEKKVPKDDTRIIFNGERVCDDCISDKYFCCYRCDSYYHNDDCQDFWGDNYCEGCYDVAIHENENEDVSISDFERDINIDSKKFTSNYEKGETITSPRIYSAEIECYCPNYDSLQKVCNKLPSDVGISEDGSLEDNGVEFQTPKLKGKAGENLISDMCQLFHDNDFKVDSSCGLHIHLDGGRKLLSPAVKSQQKEPIELKNLMLFYIKYNDVILSFLPFSRRDNRYCQPLTTNYTSDEISACKTLDELEKIWYRDGNKYRREQKKKQKYDDSRYSGINFHPLLGHNHLEVRFHSGTINAQKIIY